MASEPITKKARTTSSTSDEDLDLINRVWQHYCDYIDSCGDTEVGDIDELQEIISLSAASVCWDDSNNNNDIIPSRRKTLLPILLSVAHGNLAEYYMSQSFHDTPPPPTTTTTTATSSSSSLIRRHVQEALRHFPHNAAVWSMAANWCRMNNRSQQPLGTIIGAYQRAAECARTWREKAIAWLEQDGSGSVDEPEVKEWIEMLLLNQIVAVEWLDDDDDEHEDEDQESSVAEKTEANEGHWSASAVESTARFMLAMLLSTIGGHDEAQTQLQFFSSLTYRLHPNIWRAPYVQNGNNNDSSVVTCFGNVLPQPLYERMCQLFAPEADYWKESDYENRGYYSYFMDRPTPNQTKGPTSVLEEVIFGHLLPVVEKDCNETICGAEWWVHTRAIQANLGHNLHFDTDEAMLEQQNQVTHPCVSTVLYLTGDQLGGATVVLDQTPQATDVAREAWVNTPSDNSLLLFPGDRLHGVLPCRGRDTTDPTNLVCNLMDVEALFAKEDPSTTPTVHRLTFLVGFWTRRVPDNIKHRRLYSPCGPIPPPTDDHTWVREACKGYGASASLTAYPNGQYKPVDNMSVHVVPKVTPAWELLQSTSNATACDAPLEIPHGIDHRFFVQGAPQCFYDALFQKDRDAETSSSEEEDDEEE